MAALPFQLARRCRSSRRRTRGWRRCSARRRSRLPLASNAMPVTVEGCSSVFSFAARAVEQVDLLADRAGQQAGLGVGEAGDVLDPFHAPNAAISADLVADAAELAVIAAGDEAARPASGASASTAPSCTATLAPVPAGARGEAQRAVAEREGAGGAAAGEGARRPRRRRARAMTPRVSRMWSARERSGSCRQAAWQLSKPRRSCGRLRLRPMNTIRLVRGSPSFQGPMKSPSAIMCTAWKAKRRSSPA